MMTVGSLGANVMAAIYVSFEIFDALIDQMIERADALVITQHNDNKNDKINSSNFMSMRVQVCEAFGHLRSHGIFALHLLRSVVRVGQRHLQFCIQPSIRCCRVETLVGWLPASLRLGKVKGRARRLDVEEQHNFAHLEAHRISRFSTIRHHGVYHRCQTRVRNDTWVTYLTNELRDRICNLCVISADHVSSMLYRSRVGLNFVHQLESTDRQTRHDRSRR